MNCCEKTRIALSEGRLSGKEKRHLQECPDCRLFQKLCGLDHYLPEVPAALDAVISKTARKKTFRVFHWSRFFAMAVPAAAALALCFGLLFSLPVNTPKKPAARQSVLQNDTFEEQVFTLAMDVGTGMELDTVSDTFELMI